MGEFKSSHGEGTRTARCSLRLGVPRITWLSLVLTLAVTWIAWNEIEARYRDALEARFQAVGGALAVRIEERLRGYRQVLRGARAFFSGSEYVARDEWQEYVATLRLEEDFKGIQGLGYAVRLTPGMLAFHERLVQEEGFPDYRVWPLGEREIYTSVLMLEPFDWRNQRAFGYDMYSDPVRRDAMDRAMASGDSALSGRVRLVQETSEDTQAGVLLYLPVFDPDKPASTEDERRAVLLGWVYGAFRLDDLMDGIVGPLSQNIRLRLYDKLESPDTLLHDSQGGRPWSADERLAYTRRLTLDGREWLLRLEASPNFPVFGESRQGLLMGLGVVGVLLVAVSWLLAITRERAVELKRASESLRESEAKYSTLVNLAHEGIAATDDALRLTFVNPRLAELLDYPAEELAGQPLDRYWSGFGAEDKEALLARLRRGEVLRHEVECVARDGSRRAVLVSDAPLTDGAGVFRGAIMMLTDITERKEVEERARHLATHDPLTGLPNRMMFADLLVQTIARAERYGHRFALLFVDLDRFKEVNDRCGHLAGDQLLVEAAGRMQRSVRAADVLGRQGGDEFMVLLPEVDGPNDAAVVAEKIRAALAEPFHIDGQALEVSSSIGIVVYPDHGTDRDVLLRHADEAMYRAKGKGRNRSCIFQEEAEAGQR